MENGFDSPEDIACLIHGLVADMHKHSAVAPIRFPDPGGAFPGDILLRPPPVVVDANVLGNDIRRTCRTGQRTVLVTAANAGLLGLFCAEHVYREGIKHSGDWTATGPVTRDDFLRRWVVFADGSRLRSYASHPETPLRTATSSGPHAKLNARSAA